MPEMWKKVPDYPTYEVSSRGRVRSVKRDGTRIELKRQWSQGQSVTVSLLGCRTFSVANLVLRTFVRMPEPGEVARHYHDPDPWNLNISNLRWGTEKENADDQRRHYGAHASALRTHSEASKKQCSETMKARGHAPSAEVRAKANAARRGTHHTEESKQKMRDTIRRRKLLRMQGQT